QSTPATPNQNEKAPFHFPLKMGLIGRDGKELESKMLEMKEEKQVFTFTGLKEKPVLSINRNFSAPIKLEMQTTLAELALLLAHDTDEFNRYEAAQNLANKMIDELVANPSYAVSATYLEAIGKLITDDKIDSAFKALALELPAEEVL